MNIVRGLIKNITIERSVNRYGGPVYTYRITINKNQFKFVTINTLKIQENDSCIILYSPSIVNVVTEIFLENELRSKINKYIIRKYFYVLLILIIIAAMYFFSLSEEFIILVIPLFLVITLCVKAFFEMKNITNLLISKKPTA